MASSDASAKATRCASGSTTFGVGGRDVGEDEAQPVIKYRSKKTIKHKTEAFAKGRSLFRCGLTNRMVKFDIIRTSWRSLEKYRFFPPMNNALIAPRFWHGFYNGRMPKTIIAFNNYV